jgi:uncharacterized protein (DUF1330 family)
LATYVIADVEVTDPEPYKEYRRRFGETLARHGGRLLVVNRSCEPLEGDWRPSRLVVLEFPNTERAKAWYESPEYRAILPIRQRHARTHFVTLVEGI